MNTDRFKFRIWSEKLKRYYWNYAINVDGDLVPWMSNHKEEDVGAKLIREQCTGLRDRNDKLIYEGDVLQAPGQTIAYKVQWAHHGFVVKAGFSSAKSYPMSNCDMFEIIGNIHDDQFRDNTKFIEEKE